MTKKDLLQRLKENKPLIFDGAMGTILMQQGFGNTLAEELNVTQPKVITNIHREYVDAGVDIIETNSFNGSWLKLKELGMEDKLELLNSKAVENARKAAGDSVLVAGSMGPTGKLLEPIGDISFDDAYESYKQQALALKNGGVDLFMIETLSDIQEMRAALIAIKDLCDLPVICSMTFDKNGRLLTGSDIITAATTIAQLGGTVFSINCSFGPEGILQTYKKYYQELGQLNIPLMVMPNAGMPVIENDKAIYTMTPTEFAEIMDQFRELGVSIYAGCCGTTPAHIAALAKKVKNQPITFHNDPSSKEVYFTSRTKVVKLSQVKPFLKIGETLNPTARKKFAEELKSGKDSFLRAQAKEQTELEADLLDINVGIPELDTKRLMKKSILTLSNIVNTPLCIDSDDPKTLEEGLKNYPGIALINSVNGKVSSLERIVPLAKKYGASLIGLALDETGIPEKATARIKIVDKITNYLKENNFNINKLFIDGLVMSAASNPEGPAETINITKTLTKKGIKTSLGVSNVSFGLPERKNINNVFLQMLEKAGLSAGIVSIKTYKELTSYTPEEQLAEAVLTGTDKGAKKYIEYINSKAGSPKPVITAEKKVKTGLESIYETVIAGEEDNILELVKAEIAHSNPKDIIDKALLPALNVVGKYYSDGTYYLPQMITSANTMKKAFAFLKEKMPKESLDSKGTVIICTVEGDVHDIGKNIVGMMLGNNGFEIIDLGKNISKEIIIKEAKEHHADLILLSALLTTTMTQMKEVKAQLKRDGLDIPVMVGGAVVTPDYAEHIDANYSADAASAVQVALKLISKRKK